MTLTAPQFCDHNPTLPIDYSHKQGIVETSGESQFSVRQVIMVMEAHSTFSSLKKSLCMYVYLYISFSQNQLSIQQVIIIHAACNYLLTHLTNLCCGKLPLFIRIVITTQALDTILSIKYHIITLKSLFFLCLRLRCVLSMCLVLRKSPHSGHLCPALSTCLASMWYLTLVDLDS